MEIGLVYLASVSGCAAGIHADDVHIFISYPANSFHGIMLVVYNTKGSQPILADIISIQQQHKYHTMLR